MIHQHCFVLCRGIVQGGKEYEDPQKTPRQRGLLTKWNTIGQAQNKRTAWGQNKQGKITEQPKKLITQPRKTDLTRTNYKKIQGNKDREQGNTGSKNRQGYRTINTLEHSRTRELSKSWGIELGS